MPRYLVERDLGDLTDAQVDEAAQESERVRREDFPEIGWEHSHVVRVDGGLRSFCVYRAPDEQAIRAHAARVGIPADRIHLIHVDLVP